MNGTEVEIVTVDSLSCSIAGKPVLTAVSFSLRKGEFLSVIGPNGAGKTTLLRCLLGVLRPDAGRIAIAGDDLGLLRRREIARRIAYVPQLRNSLLPFTAREFVLMSRYTHHGSLYAPGRADHEAAALALRQTGTEPFSERRLDTLSGGECQKVYIAAALAQDCPILLLDEPVTFLDPRYRNEVGNLLHRLRQETATTIICVSHDLNSAILHADRVLALKNGRTAFLGAAQEAMNTSRLEAIFDTEFLLTPHPHHKRPVIVPLTPGETAAARRGPRNAPGPSETEVPRN